MKIKHLVKSNRTWQYSFAASLVAVILGLLIGLIIMFAFNPGSAFSGFWTMLKGGFTDGTRGLGQVLYYTTPLILAGLSVGFSFQTGVFNIGVIGQFTIGSLVAIFVGGLVEMPPTIHWLVAILAAGVAGTLWAAIPGFMKAYFKVNEIISCIMMNYIAMYLVNQLIKDHFYDRSLVATKYVNKSSLMPKLGLDKLFEGSSVNIGIFISIIVALLIYILLYRTGFGFGLRSVGFNREAGRYAGINERQNIVAVMLIAGFVAGLGGGIFHLSSISKYLKISELFIIEAGYGIPVALLGGSHPIGIIFAALFIAHITIGGSIMQGDGFPVETVEMITAVIIYFSALALIIKHFLMAKKEKREKRVQAKNLDVKTEEVT